MRDGALRRALGGPRGFVAVGVLTLLVVAVVLVAVGTRADGPAGIISSAPCDVGGENAEWSEPKGQRAVILGCGETPQGKRFTVALVRNDQLVRKNESPVECLLSDFSSDGTHFIDCHRARPPRRGTLAAPEKSNLGMSVKGQAPAMEDGYEGTTSPQVTSVGVSFRHRGRFHRLRAGYIRPPADLLKRLGIPEPFGFYAARVPRGATGVRLTAVDAAGIALGALAYRPNACNTDSGFEPSACDGRP